MFESFNADYSFIRCKAGRLAGGSDLFFCTCMLDFGDRKGGSFGHGCSGRMVPSSNPSIFTHTPQLAPNQCPTHPHPDLLLINAASRRPDTGPCKPLGNGFDTEKKPRLTRYETVPQS